MVLLYLAIIIIITLMILYGAIRIIMGWILPTQTLKAFDAAAIKAIDGIGKICFQIMILSLAALIITIIYFGMTHK